MTVTSLQKSNIFLAIAITPPRYTSSLKSLRTKCGSFPDLPNASQKTYLSIIVSPNIKTLRFCNFSICLLKLAKFSFDLIFLINFF